MMFMTHSPNKGGSSHHYNGCITIRQPGRACAAPIVTPSSLGNSPDSRYFSETVVIYHACTVFQLNLKNCTGMPETSQEGFFFSKARKGVSNMSRLVDFLHSAFYVDSESVDEWSAGDS